MVHRSEVRTLYGCKLALTSSLSGECARVTELYIDETDASYGAGRVELLVPIGRVRVRVTVHTPAEVTVHYVTYICYLVTHERLRPPRGSKKEDMFERASSTVRSSMF